MRKGDLVISRILLFGHFFRNIERSVGVNFLLCIVNATTELANDECIASGGLLVAVFPSICRERGI